MKASEQPLRLRQSPAKIRIHSSLYCGAIIFLCGIILYFSIDFFRFEIYTVNRSNKIDLSEVGICTIMLRMQRCSRPSVM